MSSSLAKHVQSGITDEQRAANARRAEEELHAAGVGIVRYDDPSVPWEIRERIKFIQDRKFRRARRRG